MTLLEYFKKINISKFEEDPYLWGIEPVFESFIDYQKAHLDLKIHIAKVIICRCFPISGGICGVDSDWLIKSFYTDFKEDILKPWITPAIKEAISMVLSGDTFSKKIIATTFLFGVIEFYAKHNLGYRPDGYDFFDDNYHEQFRKIFIGPAINKIKKTNLEIAKSFHQIDNHWMTYLNKMEIKEERWTRAKIADRVTLARNAMVHGQTHSFYDKGQYLIMLYILFHLHKVKELG